MSNTALNPAEIASIQATEEVYRRLKSGENFLLEAGAGAGKTYTLVRALQFLIDRDFQKLQRLHKKIACITFTNVAKEEIESRTDRSPVIFCETIHGFCWSLISGFQKQMREKIITMEAWSEKLAEVDELGERTIEYTLGHRKIKDDRVSIHHDDVLTLTLSFIESSKFRNILSAKYPVILIDEYQDSKSDWISSLMTHVIGNPGAPQFGFFGDHWQKIYGEGCGKIAHQSIKVIGKGANFRSVATIVNCLNRMRPELPQFVKAPTDLGTVKIFHTNNWSGIRQKGGHWGGDLPAEVAERAFRNVLRILGEDGWDLATDKTKILMLTHRVLATKQGYSSLPSVFEYNDSFAKKEDPHISFFADVLEPACKAFLEKKYGEMFHALGSAVSPIKTQSEKQIWYTAMSRLIELRERSTVGEVIDHLRKCKRPRLPDSIERRERDLEQLSQLPDEELPRMIGELKKLRQVAYAEIVALAQYLAGHSPFETKHGVKGAEFENVLVVIGRGWNRYNFNEMLELANAPTEISAAKLDAFERNRNLFYVVCSRPKRRLAILFTQALSLPAMNSIENWFEKENISSISLD